jgi:hypothetical protein
MPRPRKGQPLKNDVRNERRRELRQENKVAPKTEPATKTEPTQEYSTEEIAVIDNDKAPVNQSEEEVQAYGCSNCNSDVAVGTPNCPSCGLQFNWGALEHLGA